MWLSLRRLICLLLVLAVVSTRAQPMEFYDYRLPNMIDYVTATQGVSEPLDDLFDLCGSWTSSCTVSGTAQTMMIEFSFGAPANVSRIGNSAYGNTLASGCNCLFYRIKKSADGVQFTTVQPTTCISGLWLEPGEFLSVIQLEVTGNVCAASAEMEIFIENGEPTPLLPNAPTTTTQTTTTVTTTAPPGTTAAPPTTTAGLTTTSAVGTAPPLSTTTGNGGGAVTSTMGFAMSTATTTRDPLKQTTTLDGGPPPPTPPPTMPPTPNLTQPPDATTDAIGMDKSSDELFSPTIILMIILAALAFLVLCVIFALCMMRRSRAEKELRLQMSMAMQALSPGQTGAYQSTAGLGGHRRSVHASGRNVRRQASDREMARTYGDMPRGGAVVARTYGQTPQVYAAHGGFGGSAQSDSGSIYHDVSVIRGETSANSYNPSSTFSPSDLQSQYMNIPADLTSVHTATVNGYANTPSAPSGGGGHSGGHSGGRASRRSRSVATRSRQGLAEDPRGIRRGSIRTLHHY